MPAPPRIDVWRVLKALLFTLVVPVTAAVVVDLASGLLPLVTIAAALICIPLATIVVNRTLLAEMDRVVALVAPAPESTLGNGGVGDMAGEKCEPAHPARDGVRQVEAAP